ncbi:MAG TPA: hypothetical protein PLP83_03105 [Candidatus Aminicenantes bacterium]|nr:hypothetical protein [Candidatus Aminicenantes bacterium]
MRPKAILAAAAFLLAAAVAATSEVALDEVVQAGRFVLFRDHADAHKYYYVPDAPRLATKRDGTPEFAFIKYSKTDGATKGGVLHFLVTWGMTEGELASAESALRLKDPQAKIAGPVPFKEGTFKVVSATAGEDDLFNRKIVGEGKAPIMPGQKAAVSIALTEEGASLLWESFKNPTSDISVMFALKFAGVTPAFQAKLKVNWDKVYTQHDIKLQAEGTIKVVKLQADVRAILESLRQQGAIQLDVVGENENMQKMLDAVYGHLITLMCDKVPVGPGEAASPPAGRPTAGLRTVPEGRPVLRLGDIMLSAAGTDAEGHALPWTAPSAAEWHGPESPGSGPYPESLHYGPVRDGESVVWNGQEQDCDELTKMAADLFYVRAKAFFAAGNYPNALADVNKALEKCPREPAFLLLAGDIHYETRAYPLAGDYYAKLLQRATPFTKIDGVPLDKDRIRRRIHAIDRYSELMASGNNSIANKKYSEGIGSFLAAYAFTQDPNALFAAGKACYEQYLETNLLASMRLAETYIDQFLSETKSKYPGTYERREGNVGEALRIRDDLEERLIEAARALSAQQDRERERQAGGQQVRADQTGQQAATAGETQRSEADARRARRQQSQGGAQQGGRQQAEQTGQTQRAEQATAGAAATGAQAAAAGQSGKPPGTIDGGAKPPTGQAQGGDVAGGQAQQGITAAQGGKPPDTGGGAKPPTGATGQDATTPAAKPAAAAPEVKPIVSVQVGYSFKRVKMSGNYEVDMRKRLREDRDIVMSGNIGGVFQRYGEDRRFFSVVSLDDPTFQERAVEVILDGQDAADFKSYINAVSVLFRKQRFSGPPMTGEVKFVDQQFAQSGNRQTFKYGRLNEAATEWLDYEYKPKWSLYGGVEWEGEWTKTSDSVLTLSPPVRRRTVEISVDEDNILKSGVKALAVQVKHSLYGKDILKEVVIDYDKGDPLQTDYTYMHEDGNLGYSYKVVWLFLDGREVHTDWTAKESPFIYAVYTKK